MTMKRQRPLRNHMSDKWYMRTRAVAQMGAFTVLLFLIALVCWIAWNFSPLY